MIIKEPVSMVSYISHNKIETLCGELGITGEAAGRVLKTIDTADFSAFIPYFPGLFSIASSKESVEAIEALCKDKDGQPVDEGFRILTIFLIAILRTRELYSEMKIESEIFTATMGVFKRILGENLIAFGHLCFDRLDWCRRHITMKIFRLGTLEFEMQINEDGEHAGFPGEKNVPVLSVHIPNNAVLSRYELDRSYKMAREFFPRYFPDFKIRSIFCSTWLLAPVLSELLPPGSRILEFQSDFTITETRDNDSCMYYVYNTRKKFENYNDLPEDTSLRRSIKKHLLEGGRIGSASGYIKI